MAPQRWKVSDWKNARLAAYRLLVRGATIFGGDGKPIPRDLQLGNLRDTDYKEANGSFDPPLADAVQTSSPSKADHGVPHVKSRNDLEHDTAACGAARTTVGAVRRLSAGSRRPVERAACIGKQVRLLGFSPLAGRGNS